MFFSRMASQQGTRELARGAAFGRRTSSSDSSPANTMLLAALDMLTVALRLASRAAPRTLGARRTLGCWGSIAPFVAIRIRFCRILGFVCALKDVRPRN